MPFVLEILALHYLTSRDRQYWSHAALIFAVIHSVFVTANYVVQLATVIRARLAGAAEAVGILEQTPHSMFWDYDAIGYIAMGFVALFAILGFPWAITAPLFMLMLAITLKRRQLPTAAG